MALDPKSHPLWEMNKSVEAVTNLVFLLKTAPSNSQDTELYFELAEKELARLKELIRNELVRRHSLS